MNGGPDAGTTGRPGLVAWLLVVIAVVCLVVLVNGALDSWSASSGELGPMPLAGGSAPPLAAAAPGSGASSGRAGSARTPIPVLLERARSDNECARAVRVPIAVMIRCHRHTQPQKLRGRLWEGGRISHETAMVVGAASTR